MSEKPITINLKRLTDNLVIVGKDVSEKELSSTITDILLRALGSAEYLIVDPNQHYSKPSASEKRVLNAIREVLDMNIAVTDRLTAIADIAQRHKSDNGRSLFQKIEKKISPEVVSEDTPQS